MSLLATALGLSLLGSIGGLFVASSLLLFTDSLRTRLIPWLISYAVGALLGVALLALLPEALQTLPATTVFGTLLFGILLFFVLEKLVLWRHCHIEDCEAHDHHAEPNDHGRSGMLIIIGDSFHNFVDGILECFGKAGLDAMELRDQFGQVTVIRFADIERNPKLASDAFTFVIPKGADVIRE